MNTWLFGGTSIIGWHLAQALPAARTFCNPYVRLAACRDWPRVKLEDAEAVARLFAEDVPDTLIHCGGVCDVAKCEADPDWAQRLNVDSMTAILAGLPDSVRLVYVSSDHVFGHRDVPCDENTDVSPISVYGRTRVAAETMVLKRPNSLVLRPGLPIGASADGRSGHLDWLLYRHRKGLPITIIEDELRSAVDAGDLAERILAFADSAITGVRHVPAVQPIDRRRLAEGVGRRLAIEPALRFESRLDQSYPHLGRVELASAFDDALATPLASPIQLEGR
jgi:dTDP-4-dehydrorhamnose reductase